MVCMFIVVCVESPFSLHVVGRIQVDEGLWGKPRKETLEESGGVEVCESDSVSIGRNGSDAADESLPVESGVEFPLSFLGGPANDSRAVYDAGTVCPVEVE